MFEFKDNPFDMKFNNRGRLSPKERKRMEFCLQAYYSQMIGILETSKKTGIHPRTVSRYFKNWDANLQKSNTDSFIDLCRITKIQRIHAIDVDIANYAESEKELNNMISLAFSQNNTRDYVSLRKSLDVIINSRQKLQDQKLELVNTVTFDVDITSEVKKLSKPATDSNFDVIPLDIIPKDSEIDNLSTEAICEKDKKKHIDIHGNSPDDKSSQDDSQENPPRRKLVP